MQPLNVLEKQEDASFAADRNFRYQSLYIVLEELPSKERTAILLFYLKGYAIREIAGILDATEDAVKKQLSRGRDKLKTLLKDE
jgi:RNA polymerase sigma-70 factor (ECF subfamily)